MNRTANEIAIIENTDHLDLKGKFLILTSDKGNVYCDTEATQPYMIGDDLYLLPSSNSEEN